MQFKDRFSPCSLTAKLNFPYNHKLIGAQVLALQVPADQGAVVITAASVRYIQAGQKKSISPGLMPASIIDTRYF